jgi:Flp pilus assembly pilin Flp
MRNLRKPLARLVRAWNEAIAVEQALIAAIFWCAIAVSASELANTIH